MKDHTAKDYQARLQRVLGFIDAQPDGDLSLDGLSRVAAFSKFHFHRQFSATFGISVHRYVELARDARRSSLPTRFRYRDRAGVRLRKFRGLCSRFQTLHRADSDFRKLPAWTAWQEIYQPASNIRSTYMKREYRKDEVRIVDVSATRVALLEHHG